MFVTVIRDDTDAVATTEVSGEMTVSDVKSIIASDLALSEERMALFYLGRELTDTETIGAAGIEDNSTLTATRKQARPGASASSQAQQQQRQHGQPRQEAGTAAGAGVDPAGTEEMRQQALAHPHAPEQTRAQWPELIRAWRERQEERARMERARMERELEFMDANPTAEDQAKILEYIRLQQVEENRQAALENLPMAFGQVTMLYIPAKVNNVEIKAFVDSGAQTTIMSPDCARRCGIEHLIDKRYSGIARGVGSSKIVGRVHIANLIVGGEYLPCSFTVIEDQSLDFLLGLDMLKRHRASIDLARNVLRIPASESDQKDLEVPFLPESEIPKRELEPFEPKVEQPDGTVVGTRTGATQPAAGAGPSSAIPPPSSSTQQQPATASSSAQPSSGSGSGPVRDQVKHLAETFGCTEQEAINALRTAGGNIEVAAGILSGFM